MPRVAAVAYGVIVVAASAAVLVWRLSSEASAASAVASAVGFLCIAVVPVALRQAVARRRVSRDRR